MFILTLPDKSTAKLVLYYVEQGVKATGSLIEGERVLDILRRAVAE